MEAETGTSNKTANRNLSTVTLVKGMLQKDQVQLRPVIWTKMLNGSNFLKKM